MRAARRAGTRHATSTAVTATTTIATYVAGSVDPHDRQCERHRREQREQDRAQPCLSTRRRDPRAHRLELVDGVARRETAQRDTHAWRLGQRITRGLYEDHHPAVACLSVRDEAVGARRGVDCAEPPASSLSSTTFGVPIRSASVNGRPRFSGAGRAANGRCGARGSRHPHTDGARMAVNARA